jgi:hypothetical protein
LIKKPHKMKNPRIMENTGVKQKTKHMNACIINIAIKSKVSTLNVAPLTTLQP